MSWLLAFLGFALLIIFHELGHFAVAKAVGMRVEKFFLFFGKPIWSITRGETTYGVAAIPLGGYVKITGMNPEEARELPPELYARSYAGSPVWKRILVILAGPVVNVIIAFVLLAGVYLVNGQRIPGIGVGTVESTGAAASSLRSGDLVSAVHAPSAGTSGGTRTLPGDAPGITAREAADRLRAMTALISAGGCNARPLGTKDAQGAAQFARCVTPAAVVVTVLRDGRRQNVTVTPRYDDRRKRYRLGVTFDRLARTNQLGVLGASDMAVDQMWYVTTETAKALVKIVYDPQARKEVSSVVGGYETTRQSFEVSTSQAILVLAIISLSLAIINLFPFLPLDGGHIFWSLVEKARRGRTVSTATLERASIIGIVLVLAVFALGVTNDIGRIVNGTGFGVR